MENKKFHGTKRAQKPAAPLCAFCHLQPGTESISESDTGREVLICTECDQRMEWEVTENAKHNGGENVENDEWSLNCCGEAMLCLGLVDCLHPLVESVRRWACPNCGHGVDLVHFRFGEVELHNELELYDVAAAPLYTHQMKGGEQ